MLLAALVLLLVGAPLQLIYCARLLITKGHAEPRWYRAAMLGGLCNIAAGMLLRDPLLVTGQAAILCLYSLTRPKPKPLDPEEMEAAAQKQRAADDEG